MPGHCRDLGLTWIGFAHPKKENENSQSTIETRFSGEKMIPALIKRWIFVGVGFAHDGVDLFEDLFGIGLGEIITVGSIGGSVLLPCDGDRFRV